MRVLPVFLLLLGLAATAVAADAVTGRVVKVLPFLLDQEGRSALSPSLYDRDAYQAQLREHTNLVSAVRYDVLWSAKNADGKKLTVRLELRGTGAGNVPHFKSLEAAVTPGWFRRWTELRLDGDEYRAFTGITAWRATLWDGGTMVGEQKSFLW